MYWRGGRSIQRSISNVVAGAPWRMAAVKLHAASVLELPGDTLGASGTTIGDELEIVG